MEKNYKRTLVTCALPYANGPVHIGHLAGVYVPADIYVRYKRMKGEDVLFICGSDEHGVPITIKAKKEGVTPQDIVDRYHSIIKDSFTALGINFDIYSRTSSKVHAKNASDSSVNSMMRVNSLQENRSNIMTPRPRLSLLTAISPEHAPNAAIPMPMATSARNVEALSAPKNSLIQSQL